MKIMIMASIFEQYNNTLNTKLNTHSLTVPLFECVSVFVVFVSDSHTTYAYTNIHIFHHMYMRVYECVVALWRCGAVCKCVFVDVLILTTTKSSLLRTSKISRKRERKKRCSSSTMKKKKKRFNSKPSNIFIQFLHKQWTMDLMG